MAYNVTDNLRLDIVTDIILKLKKNRKIKLTKDIFIHSDQVIHYTSPIFKNQTVNAIYSTLFRSIITFLSLRKKT